MGSLGQGLLTFDLDHTENLPAWLLKVPLGWCDRSNFSRARNFERYRFRTCVHSCELKLNWMSVLRVSRNWEASVVLPHGTIQRSGGWWV